MKVPFLILFLAGIFNTNAQKAYIADDFLKGYTLYFVKQTKNSETKEYYKLTESQTNKTVLEYGAKELSKSETLKTAKITAFKSIPENNIHVLGDVNFDGRKDIIIHDTEKFDEGCYSPIANAGIFINTTNDFSYSQTISEVYNNIHCLRGGSFEIDNKNKRIITSSSGGAALHGCEHYSVLGKEAKMVASFQEDGYSSSPYSTISGKKWENNKWGSFTSLSLYEEGLETNKLLSFDTKNGKGRVILFKADTILYYAFRQNDEYNFISFAHPSSPEKADKSIFKFRKQNTGYELEFNSGTIKYILYETADNAGIKINVNGKISDWQGTAKTGTLATLTNTDFKNVIKE